MMILIGSGEMTMLRKQVLANWLLPALNNDTDTTKSRGADIGHQTLP